MQREGRTQDPSKPCPESVYGDELGDEKHQSSLYLPATAVDILMDSYRVNIYGGERSANVGQRTVQLDWRNPGATMHPAVDSLSLCPEMRSVCSSFHSMIGSGIRQCTQNKMEISECRVGLWASPA
ncbi:hypothetical protein F1559_001167 [Cyanidiococcus yangmingshanensis]|uniref:Uncharacterized protein n=1 Tax=Cyanidiococcus yangmingshanensis TaxID=2690220 RepID=A0A7J7IFC3_9RHOD|nr:hypothetical protein F1559_001167 [Cyanidiococcus yangmingshanensis]